MAAEDVIEGGEEDERMTLTSIHQAKGLEWKVVFMSGSQKGGYPQCVPFANRMGRRRSDGSFMSL
jgi:DNA helicase-2/ATP-dependent DNA helicase PcrA